MAWQLIYTSSPRLLEAGRTGFGTVAKHRDISGVLTGKLESISQFARLAGYNPDRIIYTHRILEAGARSYHVLSCIQNAGSDYSGRTNHIAHHLIVHAEEVASLSQRGVTPLDILYLMEWRTSWEGSSRFLDSKEEVDLSNSIAHNFSVWSSLTGKPDHARLPWSPEAAKGCYLLVPQHVDARYILGETMIHNVAKSWDMTFTTHLEPNDGLGDFRWICLPPDSPARSQVDVSARPVYDLLHPDFLPVPPAPIQATVHSPIPKQTIQYTLKPPAPTGVADKASSWGMEMLAPQRPAQRAVPPLPLKHAPSRELPKSRKKLPAVTLMLVTLGILVIGVGIWQMWDKQQKQVTTDAKNRAKTEIANLWNKHGLKMEKMEQTRKSLEKAVEEGTTPDVSEASDLLKQATEFLNAATKRLNHGIEPIETPTSPELPELIDMKNAIESWYGANQAVSNQMKSWNSWQSFHQALIDEQTKWNALIANYASPPQTEREAWQIDINRRVNEQLEKKANKPEDYAAAKQVIDWLGVKRIPVPVWLKDWKLLSEKKIDKLSTDDYAEMLRRNPPEWLKTQLDKRKPPGDSKPAPPTTILATSSMMQSPKEVTPAMINTPSPVGQTTIPSSGSPIYIAKLNNLSEQELAKLPKLPMLAQTQKLVIETLGKNDKSSLELVELPGRKFLWGFGDLRDAEKAIKISSDAIEKIPKIFGSNKGVLETSKGCVLQPMSSQGKALAKIYILTKDSVVDTLLPEFDADAAVTRLGKTKFALQLDERLRRIRLDGKLTFELVSEDAAIIPKQQFKLTPNNAATGDDEFELSLPVDPEAVTRERVNGLAADLEDRVKAEGVAKKAYEDALLTKKSKNEIEQDRQSKKGAWERRTGEKVKAETALNAAKVKFEKQQSQPKPKVAPKFGRYILLAKGVTESETPVRLCYLKLVTLK
jgi:hypothetical protein